MVPAKSIPRMAGVSGDRGRSLPMVRIMVSTVFTLDAAILIRTSPDFGVGVSMSEASKMES